jgi:hypothetical protein
MAAKPPTTPDYLNIPPYATVVADALEAQVDVMEKLSIEIGQQRVLAPVVQMLRRAALQTRAFSKDEDEQ